MKRPNVRYRKRLTLVAVLLVIAALAWFVYSHTILFLPMQVPSRIPLDYECPFPLEADVSLPDCAPAVLDGSPVGMPDDHWGEARIEFAAELRMSGGPTVPGLVSSGDDPARYRHDSDLAPGVEVFHRDRLDMVQRRLRETPGCTVLIYDQACAIENRRRRKRGMVADPARRVFINPEVCEGCGDCSEQSTCVSVLPVETADGQKRRIDQSSCNKDYSCVKGFCPSFVSIYGGSLRKPETPELDGGLFEELPTPAAAPVDDGYGVMVAGIGGTGVVTMGAILGMAAHLEGKSCSVYDMTGLSQKNGAVYSHLKFTDRPDDLVVIAVGSLDALAAA